MISAKPLHFTFDKIDRFIRVHHGNLDILVFFGPEKYDAICNRIYLIRIKSSITYVIFHNYAKIKVEFYDSLPLENKLTLHNVIVHIKSV